MNTRTGPTDKDIFLDSLERCLTDDSFIPTFYKHFLASSDEVQEKFRHTAFAKQNKMLVKSLRLSAGATRGDPESLRELRDRAETHDRFHLNITPELYTLWFEAILRAAHEFDNEWCDEIEEAWTTVLGFVIHHMLKSY